ncbi:MAG: hypothetical protein HQK96_09825 [Nitrospirae bacterium]|nr:hypothetical protein [Nitrospirota bacterium]
MKKLIFVLLASVALVLSIGAVSFADSIYGNCYAPSGEKCGDQVHTISADWNSKKAFPKNGRYELNFGGTVGKTITIYCDGSSVGDVYVHGSTQFDVHCR